MGNIIFLVRLYLCEGGSIGLGNGTIFERGFVVGLFFVRENILRKERYVNLLFYWEDYLLCFFIRIENVVRVLKLVLFYFKILKK